jgi:hypothetical protein
MIDIRQKVFAPGQVLGDEDLAESVHHLVPRAHAAWEDRSIRFLC